MDAELHPLNAFNEDLQSSFNFGVSFYLFFPNVVATSQTGRNIINCRIKLAYLCVQSLPCLLLSIINVKKKMQLEIVTEIKLFLWVNGHYLQTFIIIYGPLSSSKAVFIFIEDRPSNLSLKIQPLRERIMKKYDLMHKFYTENKILKINMMNISVIISFAPI